LSNFIVCNSTVMTRAAYFCTVLVFIRKTTQGHSTEGNSLFQSSIACAQCLMHAILHQTVLSHCSLKRPSRADRTPDQECRNLIGMREMFMHHGLCGQKIYKREHFEGYKEVVRRCKVHCIHIRYIKKK
jgi:hypothetical protein